MVRTKSQNHLSGTDVVDNTYNFSGELTASTRTNVVGAVTTTVANRYEYDHIGRKKATFEQINGGAEVVLSKLDYNELGQLAKNPCIVKRGAVSCSIRIIHTMHGAG